MGESKEAGGVNGVLGDQYGAAPCMHGASATPVHTHLKSLESWMCAPEPARLAFRHRMKSCKYGRTETQGAWLWFKAGWNDKTGNAT